MSGNSLVVYSNTGRRLMFETKDIVMPVERFAALRKQAAADERDEEGERSNQPDVGEAGPSADEPTCGVSQWFVKQWEAMKGFYMSRLWKEDSLQQLSLEEFTNRIADAVERRWENHREKQRETKRKKRQREEHASAKEKSKQEAKRRLEEEGVTRVLVVTNFISLDTFAALDLMRREAILGSIGGLIAPHGAIEASDVVADSGPAPSRTDESAPLFDDRLALRVVFRTIKESMRALAALNKAPSPVEPTRLMLVEYLPLEAVGLKDQTEGADDRAGGSRSHEKSFMDQVEEELLQTADIPSVLSASPQ